MGDRKCVVPIALLGFATIAMLGQSCGGSKNSISTPSADATATLMDARSATADALDGPIDSPVTSRSDTKAEAGDVSNREAGDVSNRLIDSPVAPPSDAPIIEPPPPGSAPILVGAGDIGTCGSPGASLTGKILDALFPKGGGPSIGYVITLGDNAYDHGNKEDYTNCYDGHWGRHKAWTKPSTGNHDYHLKGVPAYFYEYFDNKFGSLETGAYYSYDVGTWHVVVLDNYGPIGLSRGSAQLAWLRTDLAANAGKKCTLAYFHRGRFASGHHGSSEADDGPGNAWKVFQEFKLDVVLSGHDHIYERFAPMTWDGALDTTNGVRQFIVGTGGGNLNKEFDNPAPNSEVRYKDGWGVIKLTLHPDRYDYEFISEPGKTFTDKGTEMCH